MPRAPDLRVSAVSFEAAFVSGIFPRRSGPGAGSSSLAGVRPGLPGFRCTGWLGGCRTDVPKPAVDPGRGQTARRCRAFPGAAQVSGQRSGQPRWAWAVIVIQVQRSAARSRISGTVQPRTCSTTAGRCAQGASCTGYICESGSVNAPVIKLDALLALVAEVGQRRESRAVSDEGDGPPRGQMQLCPQSVALPGPDSTVGVVPGGEPVAVRWLLGLLFERMAGTVSSGRG
jgi:hypothetical protein